MRAEIKTGELLKEMAERKERRDGHGDQTKAGKKAGSQAHPKQFRPGSLRRPMHWRVTMWGPGNSCVWGIRVYEDRYNGAYAGGHWLAFSARTTETVPYSPE